MVHVQVRDDDVGEREGVDAEPAQPVDRAAAAVEQHGGAAGLDHERGVVARGRGERAGGAQESEARHGHRPARSASGSKRASGTPPFSVTARTTMSSSSLPSTNASWR